MKHFNKLQTLLNDLLDKALHRRWHVRCMKCGWECRYLKHKRFADNRRSAHESNTHFHFYDAKMQGYYTPSYLVWHSRA